MIVRVDATAIHVQPENGLQRRVPQGDFEKTFALWDRYRADQVQRQEIRDLTRHSVYILSILHWTENQQTSKRRGSILGL